MFVRLIGALIVKRKLKLNDRERETLVTVSKNIYLQYFCGLRSFQIEEPFHPNFVDIRKRMRSDRFGLWNELIAEKADSIKPKRKQHIDKDRGDRETPTTDKGTLKNSYRCQSENCISYRC